MSAAAHTVALGEIRDVDGAGQNPYHVNEGNRVRIQGLTARCNGLEGNALCITDSDEDEQSDGDGDAHKSAAAPTSIGMTNSNKADGCVDVRQVKIEEEVDELTMMLAVLEKRTEGTKHVNVGKKNCIGVLFILDVCDEAGDVRDRG